MMSLSASFVENHEPRGLVDGVGLSESYGMPAALDHADELVRVISTGMDELSFKGYEFGPDLFHSTQNIVSNGNFGSVDEFCSPLSSGSQMTAKDVTFAGAREDGAPANHEVSSFISEPLAHDRFVYGFTPSVPTTLLDVHVDTGGRFVKDGFSFRSPMVPGLEELHPAPPLTYRAQAPIFAGAHAQLMMGNVGVFSAEGLGQAHRDLGNHRGFVSTIPTLDDEPRKDSSSVHASFDGAKNIACGDRCPPLRCWIASNDPMMAVVVDTVDLEKLKDKESMLAEEKKLVELEGDNSQEAKTERRKLQNRLAQRRRRKRNSMSEFYEEQCIAPLWMLDIDPNLARRRRKSTDFTCAEERQEWRRQQNREAKRRYRERNKVRMSGDPRPESVADSDQLTLEKLHEIREVYGSFDACHRQIRTQGAAGSSYRPANCYDQSELTD